MSISEDNWNLEMTAVFKEFIWLLIIDWLPFSGREKVCAVLNRLKICVVYDDHFLGFKFHPATHSTGIWSWPGHSSHHCWVFSGSCLVTVVWVIPVQVLYLCPLSIIVLLTGGMLLTVAWHTILYYNFKAAVKLEVLKHQMQTAEVGASA